MMQLKVEGYAHEKILSINIEFKKGIPLTDITDTSESPTKMRNNCKLVELFVK